MVRRMRSSTVSMVTASCCRSGLVSTTSTLSVQPLQELFTLPIISLDANQMLEASRTHTSLGSSSTSR